MQLKCILVILVALVAVAGPAKADLKVVTTTPDLAAVAQAVGRGHVQVTSLSLHTQDPHWVDARPNLVLELAKADLLVLVGLELEVGWLPTLLTSSRNGVIQRGDKGYLDASQLVSLLDVPVGKVDRSMGDVHPGGNPHYMYDPRRAAKVALGIAQRMSLLDPAHGKTYSANAAEFTKKLAKWQKHWETQLKHLKGQKVIAYHKSFTYVADWLGFETLIHLEPKPGIAPNPGHLTHVIEVGKRNHVRLLLQESFFPTKTAELVAQKVGAELVVLPGGPNFRANQSYIGFVDDYVQRLSKSRS